MSFKKYIKAVGTGPKGNRELEESEVIDAIESILENRVTQAQIGAFLIGWRTKLETDGELTAAVKALKKTHDLANLKTLISFDPIDADSIKFFE